MCVRPERRVVVDPHDRNGVSFRPAGLPVGSQQLAVLHLECGCQHGDLREVHSVGWGIDGDALNALGLAGARER
jgi:hypothetical protein